ncbi:MAG: large-conductance mechanosensitive channel protein MscL [bacterium]|nr:large-conductance mechanosensitive channel protein MscL [bacterium]
MLTSFIKEFRAFALRGNVVDMAVGIIIGGAFGKIVSSLVNDIVMPPLTFLVSGIDISDRVIVLRQATDLSASIVISYGSFFAATLDFLIIAFAVFLVIRQINRIRQIAEPVKAPTTKTCSFCISTISQKAIKCPQCTADLPA